MKGSKTNPNPNPLARPDAGEAPSATLSGADLQVLRASFPKDRLGVKVQSLSREKNRAMLVLYLQHTDVQDRLEEVDPAWTSEVLSEERSGDTVYVRTRMTLKGVARENVGEGADPKSAYSDALKRCAMLFGVGRYLYDSPTVWADYDETRDRYRQWSVDDFETALHRTAKRPGVPAADPIVETKAVPPKPGVTARPAAAARARPPSPSPSPSGDPAREELNRNLMALYQPYLKRFPDANFQELLESRYGFRETRSMSAGQLSDLVEFMGTQLRAAA